MTVNDPSSCRESIEGFKDAAEVQDGFAYDRLNCAIMRSGHPFYTAAFHSMSWTNRSREALQGYKHAIQLLIRTAWIGLSTTLRLARLYSIPRTLASDVTICAIRLAEVISRRSVPGLSDEAIHVAPGLHCADFKLQERNRHHVDHVRRARAYRGRKGT